VHVTSGRKIRVRLNRKAPYELDGGARKKSRTLRIKVHPASVRICVPVGDQD
jgi:diacylglycerol kinase family enzyme